MGNFFKKGLFLDKRRKSMKKILKNITKVLLTVMCSILILIGFTFAYLIYQDLKFDEDNYEEPTAEENVNK